MRVVFAGTPGIAAACLQALMDTPDIALVGVVTQPDRRAGRGMKFTPSPVRQLADAHGIDCITPEDLRNPADLQWLRQKQADFLVVVAFGMILPSSWLKAANIAPINVHASLLPRWRGAAPIERALLNGDQETGVCIMRMEEGLDTGPVYCRTKLAIEANMTGNMLWQAIQQAACQLLPVALNEIMHGNLCAIPQSRKGISYAEKIKAEDRLINWSSAILADRQVRCFTPRPGARCHYRGRWLKIIEGDPLPVSDTPSNAGHILHIGQHGVDVACADGSAYRLLTVQPEGKKAMSAADFARGQRLQAGDSLVAD